MKKMETVSLAPTVKQRRKFERVETANMNNDTSSVNHVSDVYTMGNLSKHEHEEAQTLGDCCKKFIRNKKASQGGFIGSINQYSGQEDPPKMHRILLYAIAAAPFATCLVGIFITYTMYRYESQEGSAFVYISETALNYPQSSIFSLSLHSCAVSCALAIFLRHLTLTQFIRDHGQGGMKECWIKISTWLNVLVYLSLQLIGNFPAMTIDELSVHLVSVVTFFVSTTMYVIIQSKLTYQTIDMLCDRRIYHLRVAILTMMLISAFAAFIPGTISWRQFDGEDYRNWQPNDSGYIWHVISVIGEWLYVYLCSLYILTFVHEFRSMSVEFPVIKITYLPAKGKMDFKTRAL